MATAMSETHLASDEKTTVREPGLSEETGSIAAETVSRKISDNPQQFLSTTRVGNQGE